MDGMVAKAFVPWFAWTHDQDGNEQKVLFVETHNFKDGRIRCDMYYREHLARSVFMLMTEIIKMPGYEETKTDDVAKLYEFVFGR